MNHISSQLSYFRNVYSFNVIVFDFIDYKLTRVKEFHSLLIESLSIHHHQALQIYIYYHNKHSLSAPDLWQSQSL